MPEATLLSLHRHTATCGCTGEGPGATCEQGQRLFELVRQAYAQVCGADPHDHVPWAIYETQRARYYAHLGEMANYLDMMSSFAAFYPERGAFQGGSGTTNSTVSSPLPPAFIERMRLALQQLEQLVEDAEQIATGINRLYLEVPRDNSPLDQMMTYARLRCLYALQLAGEALKYLAFVLGELSALAVTGQE